MYSSSCDLREDFRRLPADRSPKVKTIDNCFKNSVSCIFMDVPGIVAWTAMAAITIM